MPIDQNLNKILKEMWRLDEKLAAEDLSIEEKEFFNTHLETIMKYYESSSAYWNKKEEL